MSDSMIKKGPWKAEEDEVLRKHVKKYGPRDWSSIRSKGLLQRTGKSCRLRWVNKLRPNLKNGVKFSAEEERTVIELQAQFGNKWARIATYLPGRTDNDVKNFWSSRQKKLARIMRTSVPQPSKPQKSNNREPPTLQKLPSVEGPKLSSLEEERSLSMSQYCPSSYMNNSDTINMVQWPELVNSTSLIFEPDPLQPEFIPNEKGTWFGSQIPLPFPEIPLQTDFLHPLEDQILPMKLEESDFLDFFEQLSASDIGNVQVPFVPASCSGPERSTEIITVKREIDVPLTPDSFIDDFPMDMFDHIDPLPSPFNW
ncbi:PREDICTED: transcription factor MYB59-like [Nicotiana attenuata]|uniref:Transcription factor gamyb n=1 Tax=Nicotiana attenuata TaxID=49451 RepID=A0A314KZA9_NICAT|nr:PREDICTED: transcription factor MYB59-like [Nicotiana attenuata]OIT34505.1 transcription factor gamyb [Nicotiana attenuata]